MTKQQSGAAVAVLLRSLAAVAERDKATASAVAQVLRIGKIWQTKHNPTGAKAIERVVRAVGAGLDAPRVGRPAKSEEHRLIAQVYRVAMGMKKAGKLTQHEKDAAIDALAELVGVEPSTVANIASRARAAAAAEPVTDDEDAERGIRLMIEGWRP